MGEQTSEKGKNLHMIIITHRGRSLKIFAKFVPLMTTYLPLVDIGEGIPFLLQEKIFITLTFSVPPTYLFLSK